MALGANLGDPVQTIGRAVERLGAFSEARPECSSLWQTAPLDCPEGSPPYVNAVARLFVAEALDPAELLRRLLAVEREFGRRPKQQHNEPRPLDLDLIHVEGRVSSTPGLVLPHPRAHLRRFVLAPLAELAPGLVLPGQDLSVAELLAGLGQSQAAERIG